MQDIPQGFANALSDRYHLERELGRGGMATVYLARDAKHDRAVAIKVLRPELAHSIGADRFLREVRVTAQLDHPHILSLLDSGEADGSLFYVMPFVDGESLRDRLAREKQLPIDDALRIAREVADALSYAHARNIVHRDIKPENILLATGHARVADFGIARAVTIAAGDKLTATGIAVGTPAYMSPEQAAGSGDVDARSDVYALACVTYEMIAGKPPFTGPTAESIVRQHISVAPLTLSALRPSVPIVVADALSRALAKVPADRFASATHFSAALDTNYAAATGASFLARSRQTIPWVVAAAALALLASNTRPRTSDTTDPPVRRTTIVLPDSAPVAFGSGSLGLGGRAFTLSPDGTTLAYVAAVRDTTMLYLRRFDDAESHAVPESEGAVVPFFSPDGNWIGFLAGNQVKKAPVSGGAAIPLATLTEPGMAVWLADGRIAVCDMIARGAFVRAGGGRSAGHPQCGSSTSSQSVGSRWMLRYGGREISFVDLSDSAERVVRFLGVNGMTGSSTEIPAGQRQLGVSPAWAGGHLVFAQAGDAGTLMAIPFDTARMRGSGTPVPVAHRLRTEGGDDGNVQYSVASDGTLVYAEGSNEMMAHLVFRDRSGRLDTLPIGKLDLDRHELSWSGRQLVARWSRPGAEPRFVVFDTKTGARTMLPDSIEHCTWTEDESSVLCGRRAPDGRSVGLRISLPSGAIGDTVIRDGIPRSASRDGNVLVVRRSGPVWIVRKTPAGETASEINANVLSKVSPDGGWIATTRPEPGGWQIYVVNAANPAETYQISTTGGEEPLWSSAGNEIIYRYGNSWYSVNVSTKGRFTHTPPRLLFADRFYNAPGYSHAIAPDGRLLLIQGSPVATTTRLEVVTGWFAELRRLAPVAARR